MTWTKAAAEMKGNYPIQCVLEASQQNLLMGETWGKGKQKEEAEMTSW